MAQPLDVKVQVGIGTTKSQFQKEIQMLVDKTPVKLNVQLNIDKRTLQQTLSASGITTFGKDIGNSISQNIESGIKSAQAGMQRFQGSLENLKAQYASLQTTANNPKFGGSITGASTITKDITGMQSAINLYNKGLISAEQATSLYNQRMLSAKNSISLFSKELKIASKSNTNLNASLSQSKGFANLEKQITDYVNKFSNVANNPVAMAQIDGLYERMQSGQTTLTMAQNDWAMMSNEFKQMGLEAETAGQRLGTLFKTHFATGAVMLGIHAIQQGLHDIWQAVLDVDSAMVELRKITNETEATYQKFLDGTLARSQKTAASLSEIINVTADWARLGLIQWSPLVVTQG